MRRVHLICNAHIDPVWQWGWPEGLGVILSTFRVAADFCEEFDNFVFNHNEALLYKCIEEFDPALFDRIKALVKAGKWRIMGGWYLQPDCNMLSGESIVRQISASRKYFMEKFGVKVTTAVNMDSFGHSRGLVQILQQAGYTGYLFMRPDAHVYTFEEFEQGFRWKGYCDSEIKGYRLNTSYNTIYGTAAQTIRDYIYSNKNPDSILRCWGIGDHGGGPSRVDIIAINELIENECENEIIHSSPDDFMGELDINRLPVFSRDLNPIFVGCYTTMANVKKLHRRLENNLAFAEKVSSVCDIEGLVAYPDLKIKEAYEDLMFCQFHDVIAGTCTKPVERQMVQKLSHGLEITDNIILKAFYALSKDQKAAEGTRHPSPPALYCR